MLPHQRSWIWPHLKEAVGVCLQGRRTICKSLKSQKLSKAVMLVEPQLQGPQPSLFWPHLEEAVGVRLQGRCAPLAGACKVLGLHELSRTDAPRLHQVYVRHRQLLAGRHAPDRAHMHVAACNTPARSCHMPWQASLPCPRFSGRNFTGSVFTQRVRNFGVAFDSPSQLADSRADPSTI
jgi:hypothetical protein